MPHNLDGTPIQIDRKVPGGNRAGLFLGRRGPPQLRPDPRQQFIHAERFGDVVVGARVESFHLRAILSAHREHDDRHLRRFPQLPAQIHTIHIRHRQVRHHHVRRPIFHQLQRHLPVVGYADVVPLR